MPETEFKAGPEGGGGSGSASPPKESLKTRFQNIMQRISGILWIGLDGYILYAFCYVVVWHHVRYRNRGAAIAILVIFSVLNFYLALSWAALHAWGPGKITKDYTRKTDSNPDDAFLCDEQGYSLYCSYCKHIKPNRTHHSSYSDTCVPVMDHFCPWVGNVIGQLNYKFFLQFCWTAFMGILLILITLFIYQHDQVPHINGNSIALYIVTGLTGAFLFSLLMQHTLYLLLCQTTLEHMGYRRNKLPYVNLLWRDHERRVIQPTKKDLVMPHGSPFTQGMWKNIINVMGPIYMWLLPIPPKIYEPQFSTSFLDKMRERIKE